MIDSSVKNFYKSKDSEYAKRYHLEHSPRLDFMIDHFDLGQIKNKRVIDFGCGAGDIFAKLNKDNEFIGFEGADLDSKLVPFQQLQVDLDDGIYYNEQSHNWPLADIGFCCEVVEHLQSPYKACLAMKSYLCQNSTMYFSVPEQRMTHNTPIPGLIYPIENFVVFLEQMAWIVEEKVLFDGDWPSWILKCRNAPMDGQKMLFPKNERKFWGNPPHIWTNL